MNLKLVLAVLCMTVFHMVNAIAADPTVSDNTISWLDSGWYEVQRADDNGEYKTVCQGGTSCTVEPGLYNVINHSKNIRYENIEVVDSSGSGSAPSTIGKTITVPDGGEWWEVQIARNYKPVCQSTGGYTCNVAEWGSYNVINHSKNIRYDIMVKEPEFEGGFASRCTSKASGIYQKQILYFYPTGKGDTTTVQNGVFWINISTYTSSNCSSSSETGEIRFTAKYSHHINQQQSVSGVTADRIDISYESAWVPGTGISGYESYELEAQGLLYVDNNQNYYFGDTQSGMDLNDRYSKFFSYLNY